VTHVILWFTVLLVQLQCARLVAAVVTGLPDATNGHLAPL
jgi:hypothetical protein